MNHSKKEYQNIAEAAIYLQSCLKKHLPLDQNILLNCHRILMNGISHGGVYRSIPVFIGGRDYEPPLPDKVPFLMNQYFENYHMKNNICNMPESNIHPITLSSFVHNELVHIHPFLDGNGRIARLMMNYVLEQYNYPRIIITDVMRDNYYNALKNYDSNSSLKSFENFLGNAIVEQSKNQIRLAENIKKNNTIQKKRQSIHFPEL